MLRALVPGFGIPAAVLAYPVYFLLAGREHLNGPAFPSYNPYRADLLGMVVPTISQLFAPHHLALIGASYVGGDLAENGSYLGIPLLALTLVCVVRYWRNPWIRLVSVLAASAFVLSLGPRLVIANHVTLIRLPFDVLVSLPVLDNILPAADLALCDLLRGGDHLDDRRILGERAAITTSTPSGVGPTRDCSLGGRCCHLAGPELARFDGRHQLRRARLLQIACLKRDSGWRGRPHVPVRDVSMGSSDALARLQRVHDEVAGHMVALHPFCPYIALEARFNR